MITVLFFALIYPGWSPDPLVYPQTVALNWEAQYPTPIDCSEWGGACDFDTCYPDTPKVCVDSVRVMNINDWY
jgi:hypothetical protein